MRETDGRDPPKVNPAEGGQKKHIKIDGSNMAKICLRKSIEHLHKVWKKNDELWD